VAPAATRAPNPQTTELAPVSVRAEAAARDAEIGPWGNASIHDTPAAISVIGRERLDDHAIGSLRDLAQQDAALGDGYAPVGYIQNLTIRGYPLDFATGYRIDNLTVTGQQYIALENVAEVQVLKGLAGVDAGVVAPGGTVNFVTKRPAPVRTITLGTDAHGSRYGALDVGGWLTPDFGLRANLAWEDTHSYVRHADARRNFYALAADWRITPRARLQLDADYQAYAQRSVSGYQLLGGTQLPRNADPAKLLGFEPWQQPTSVASSNDSARFDYTLSDAWRLKLAAGHSRSVVQDNAAFAYGCGESSACADAPGTGVYFAPNGDYGVWDFRSPNETYVDDQVRASLAGELGAGFVTHDLSVGVSAFHHTKDLPEEVFAPIGTANITDRDPPYFPPSPAQPGPVMRRLDTWQRSAFALDRVHFGDSWQVLAGGRFVRLNERTYDADGHAQRVTQLARVLPQVAVLWQPVDPLTTYVSYSKGLSLGKQAPYWTSNAGDTLGPRLSRQIELGTKYRWHDSLDLGAAVYRIVQPWQFARPDATPAGYTFVQRGENQHTGLELSAHGRVNAALRVNASVSWIRARARNTGTPAYEGHQSMNVPKLRSKVYLDYRLPFAPAWHVLGGWRYASPNSARADGRVRAPAWNVFDAGLRYATRWDRHRVTWRLWVENLFDRFYWQYTGSDGSDSYLLPGAPRLARLSLKIEL
jgi:iron complex outermembrane receptor protein